MLASLSSDLQHALGQFVAQCEAAEIRVSTSKSEAMVLSWKRVGCYFQVRNEILPQAEVFKYLGSCSQVRVEWNRKLIDGLVQGQHLCGDMLW